LGLGAGVLGFFEDMFFEDKALAGVRQFSMTEKGGRFVELSDASGHFFGVCMC